MRLAARIELEAEENVTEHLSIREGILIHLGGKEDRAGSFGIFAASLTTGTPGAAVSLTFAINKSAADWAPFRPECLCLN